MNYTTEDYLTQLQQDREDLIDNLEAKGITGLSGDETFTELVPEVLNIPSGEKFGFINGGGISLQYATNDIQSEIDNIVANVDTSTITSLEAFLAYNSYAENIDLSGFDTSNVEKLDAVFVNCSNLEEVNLSTWNMYFDASGNNLKPNYMFMGCTNLQKIDMRGFEFGTLDSDFNSIFGVPDTPNLVPANCLIIVKDNTQKQKIQSYYNGRYTNVKTVAEYEAS